MVFAGTVELALQVLQYTSIDGEHSEVVVKEGQHSVVLLSRFRYRTDGMTPVLCGVPEMSRNRSERQLNSAPLHPQKLNVAHV